MLVLGREKDIKVSHGALEEGRVRNPALGRVLRVV